MDRSTNHKFPDIYNSTVAIIGLGYVGLPLAIEIANNKKCNFSGKNISRKIIGYDINHSRISQLKNNNDITSEVSKTKLKNTNNIKYTSDIKDLYECDIYIITVPTPIDLNNKPDLTLLKSASKLIGECIGIRKSPNSPIIIFESTVFPGATEEICIPIIEKHSNLKIDTNDSSLNYKRFACGYSPERVNPGDKKRKIPDITKITSGSSKDSAKLIDLFYKTFIKAGTYPVETIKVGEAAKVIENTQRDVNIALINELSKIFTLMNIDTNDVLDAASSKWNFLRFKPGLVGGHCIGVDPYYLTYKAAEYGYHAEIVLSGRRINESMSKYVADRLILEMCKRQINVSKANILIMGVTFKEDCTDIRNSKVFDIAKRLKECNAKIDLYDPLASEEQVSRYHNYKLYKSLDNLYDYSAIVVAVAHKEFKEKSEDFWTNLIDQNIIIFDVKSILPRHKNIVRL